jgi:hypothetical protein
MAMALPAGRGGRWALRAWRLGRDGLGRAFGLGPVGKDRICFCSSFFSAKQIQEIQEKCLQGTKNTPKIPKIAGKFPEVDWSTTNPNKVFGAHEKDYRALYK